MAKRLWGDATHLSGPVSVTVMRNIYLLGDVHFDYDNECPVPSFAKRRVITLYELMTKALSEGAKVYLEYPVADAKIPKKSRWYSERLQSLLEMDGSWSAQVGAVLSGVLGVPQPVIGEFGRLHGVLPAGTDSVVPLDIRTDPNVHAWEAVQRDLGDEGLRDAFFASDLTAARFDAWMHCYLHSSDFLGDVRRAFKDSPIVAHFTAATLRNRQHPIRHKFMALKPQDRFAVSDFFAVKVKDVVKLRDKCHKKTIDAKDVLQMMLSTIMDMYAVCLLLPAWHDGGTCVVYCGNFHVMNYKEFFEVYTGRSPDGHVKMMQLPGRGGVRRCLKLPA